MDYSIYIIAGALLVAYVLFSIITRGRSKRRKGRSFMEDFKRKDKEEDK